MTLGIDSIGFGFFHLEYTIIDPEVYVPSEGVQCTASFDLDPDFNAVPYVLIFESQGFSITGECTKETLIEDGEEVCSFVGQTEEIHVFDIDKYPGNVTEVSFRIEL